MLLASETSIQLTNALEKLIDSGIQLGERVLGALIIFIIGKFLVNWLNRLFARILEKRKVDPSIQSFLKSMVNILLLIMLILAVTYMTSAAVVFFRDLSQIINIALQVGVWVTPIMWDFNDLGLGGILQKILKLNPLFYIVQGYRDSLINKVAIWDHPVLTLYFWVFTLAVFIFGTRLFKKLQVHFADVL